MMSFEPALVCKQCWKPIIFVYDAHHRWNWGQVLNEDPQGQKYITLACNGVALGGHVPDWDPDLASHDLDRVISATKPRLRS